MACCYTPIHTLVHPSQISTYSSLAGALTPAAPPSQFNSPHRRRIPQTACKTVDTPAFPPISFDYFSQSRQGVALRDFQVKSQHAFAQLMAGANELVLENAKISKVDLRIMWLGYEHIDCSFSFAVPQNITRGKLGASIANQLRKFIEKAEASSSSVPAWRVGPDAISFDQLYLVALYNFGGNVCQADIAVDPAPLVHQ